MRADTENVPGSLAMISTTNPETMTTNERRLEVAGILARGLLQRVRMSEKSELSPGKKVSETSQNDLAVPAKTRLSVAPRPGG